MSSLIEAPASSVRVIDNDWVELPDGVRLAIRLWLPAGAEERDGA